MFIKPNLHNKYFLINNNKNQICMYNPIIGSELGIPLNILQYIFTNLYYHENIITPQLILMQIAIGVFTYGSDRIFDAFEYSNSLEKGIYSDNKIKFYDDILNTIDKKYLVIYLSYIYLFFNLIKEVELIPILILLTSTLKYRDIKSKYGEYKAIYIGIFWTIGSIILPCIIHDHSYEILNHPNIYLPDMLLMFGCSNMLDIKDIEEDKKNNINTLPVKYGEETSKNITNISYIISFVIVMYDLWDFLY